MEPFVVSINPAGQAAYRRFWSGRLGSAVLIIPGLVVALAGLLLGLRPGGSGPAVLFTGVIIFCGLYASYTGWDHRRRAVRRPPVAPLAFALEPDGAVFPRNKRYPWVEVRFVLTTEAKPRILCSPLGLAYLVDHLDRAPAEIDAALNAMSSGQTRLEQV